MTTIYSICTDMPALRSQVLAADPRVQGLIDSIGGVARRYNADRTQSVAALNASALTNPLLEPLQLLPYVYLTRPEWLFGYRVIKRDEGGGIIYEAEQSIVGYSNVPVYETQTDEEGNEHQARIGYQKEPVYGYAPQYDIIAPSDPDNLARYQAIYEYIVDGEQVRCPVFGTQGPVDHITGVY